MLCALQGVTGDDELYRPLLDAIGLTYPQYLVLLVLWDRGATPPSPASATPLQLETGTLSPLLKRLEASGFITRTRQADDERSVLVTLTGAGAIWRRASPTCRRQVEPGHRPDGGELADMRSSLRG